MIICFPIEKTLGFNYCSSTIQSKLINLWNLKSYKFWNNTKVYSFGWAKNNDGVSPKFNFLFYDEVILI